MDSLHKPRNQIENSEKSIMMKCKIHPHHLAKTLRQNEQMLLILFLSSEKSNKTEQGSYATRAVTSLFGFMN